MAIAGYVAMTGGVPAQPEPMLVLAFDPAMSIRQLADDYLGDADLWTEILEASGLPSVVDLEPGQELRLPVSQVKAANRALNLAQRGIQHANQTGAQLFAPRIIARAIGLYDEALVERTLGAWLETFRIAQESRTTAGKAYEVSRRNRDQAGEARLSDKQGSVEGQKPRDLVWEDRPLDAILIEEEKVRTLSDSSAQITFRDASRLRLNPNSQAVIQRLRVDPLTRREDAEVSLIEGDFYALLGDTSERQRFEVDVPGVEASVDSGDFWVSHDASGEAKFTNYDVAPVRISARGETVTLDRNQGVVVHADDSAVRKVDVLPAPAPQAPGENRPTVAGRVLLRWSRVPDAAGYWLEIGHDRRFQRLATTRKGIAKPRFSAERLAPGIYYWRVSALDRFGLPGARSEVRRLEVRADTVPPYLRVERPEPGRVLRQSPVVVAGLSEPDARLTIDGREVEVGDDGGFTHAVSPVEGDNELHLRVTDRAGNETTKARHVTYMPDRPAEIRYAPDLPRLAPDHLLAHEDTLSLVGRTLGLARLIVQAEDGSRLATGRADAAGGFRMGVPLTAGDQELTVRVVAPSGYVTPVRLRVTLDADAPEIALDTPLPRVTRDAALRVRGTLSEPATLYVNGRETAIAEKRFARRIRLAEGENTIEVVAVDAAGNVGVSRQRVRLDTTPPELVDHRILATPDAGGAGLHVTVSARDASGLARIAPCTVVTRRGSASGFLRYDPETESYEGVLRAAAAGGAEARLAGVELTDDVGNTTTLSLD